jgi:hypothetical protein
VLAGISIPLLKLRPRKDLVETLLHEMIHAYLFVTDNNKVAAVFTTCSTLISFYITSSSPFFNNSSFGLEGYFGDENHVSSSDIIYVSHRDPRKSLGPLVSLSVSYLSFLMWLSQIPPPSLLLWEDYFTDV